MAPEGRARVANREHVEIVGRGRYIWNQWRADHPDVKPDLRGAYLREANLKDYNFSNTDLRTAMMLGADLKGANLEGADLSFADVRFVEFAGANLHNARFHEAKGVETWVLNAARGPAFWKRHLRKAAAAAAVAVVGYGLWSSGLFTAELRAWSAEATEWTAGWGDSADTGPDSETEALRRRIEQIEKRLTQIEFSTWRIAQVRGDDSGLVVRTDQPQVSENVYLPTVAAACGVLAGQDDRWAPAEIHVLDKQERTGWTFESPDTCAELIQAPPKVMRLAIAAETKNYRPPGP